MRRLLLATAVAVALVAPAGAYEQFSAGQNPSSWALGLFKAGMPRNEPNWRTLTMDECHQHVDAYLAPRGLELSRIDMWDACDRLVRGLSYRTTARPRTGTPDGDYVNQCEENFWQRSPAVYSRRGVTIKSVEQNCIDKLRGRKMHESCQQWWKDNQQIPTAPIDPPCITPSADRSCIAEARAGTMGEACQQWWLKEAKSVLNTP